jgi:catechol 2,3-dioxygenase-like lactoylglutathione lyase family enzyme
MLTNAEVHPTIPAVDLERARKFYEGTLGLKVLKTDASPGVLMQAGGGTSLYIFKRGATKADHTAASFTATDVAATVSALRAKGVVFEEVNIPEAGIRTVDGVAELGGAHAAWFKDTEGNILSITDM